MPIMWWKARKASGEIWISLDIQIKGHKDVGLSER